MNTGDRIKQRRIELRLTVDELAEKIGKSRATIYRYENGDIENMPTTILEPLAKALETTPADLMGWEKIDSSFSGKAAPPEVYDKFLKNLSDHLGAKGVSIPVLGRVAAGIPIEAIEEIIDTEEIPETLAKTGEFFGLQIHGNSMEPRMCEGDVVIVRKQDDAESGDIVIAMVNGDDATCKRLRKYKEGIELISNNPSYKPMFFSNEEIENKPVKIIGKVVELRGKF